MAKAKTQLTDYAQPSVTVDVLVFTILDNELKVALIKRGVAPYQGRWAIPGGFVQMEESLEDAARREIREEAGLSDVFLEQLYTFGEVKRDPRGRVITVAYYALVPGEKLKLSASTDAADSRWFSIDELPKLAFDHAKVLEVALQRLRSKIGYSTIASALLPETFRLSDLQKVYEILLGEEIDKRNFRKRMLSLDLLETTRYIDSSGSHRPAQLYRFKKKEIQFFK
jgi:8-oxo-dGTP diphosphatase